MSVTKFLRFQEHVSFNSMDSGCYEFQFYGLIFHIGGLYAENLNSFIFSLVLEVEVLYFIGLDP